MKKQCKRKIYALINPIEHAMQGAGLIDKASSDKVKLLELSALESFAKGRATKDDWRQLCMMTNVAEQLARMGYDKDEIIEPCEKATAALKEAHRRFKEHGKLGLSGLELGDMRKICAWAHLQRGIVPRYHFEQAIDKVRRLIVGRSPLVEVLL